MGDLATLEIVPHGSDLYLQTVDLRSRVLRHPLGLTFLKEELEAEADSIHLALIREKSVIACLVLVPKTSGEMKMRQVAVDPDFQSQGLGSQLVRESERICSGHAAEQITLHARDSAVVFYEKLGYLADQAPFLEVGIPHRFMSKRL